MLLQVFSQKDKEKLIQDGFKFITEQKLGDNIVYVFEADNKLNFSDLDIKARFTNKLYF